MLIEKVSEVVYELEGISTGVSKRTVQADIQFMRSNKLGYNAPIVVTDRKYYSYSDPDYSINQSRLTEADMGKMNEIVGVLRQMSGFNYFDEMSDIITRLENTMQKSIGNTGNLIQMEGNHLLKGIEHVSTLYHAISQKIPLLIQYQSFKADVPRQDIYFPYLLKEYRNRWFLICRNRKSPALQTLALDRIVDFMEMLPKDYEEYDGVDFERYFSDTIGVTKTQKDRAYKVIFHVEKSNVPYLITKPLHPTQQILKTDETGGIFRIDVVLNFELERELLGFGECLTVMAPRFLQGRIRKRLEKAVGNYGKQIEKD